MVTVCKGHKLSTEDFGTQGSWVRELRSQVACPSVSFPTEQLGEKDVIVFVFQWGRWRVKS